MSKTDNLLTTNASAFGFVKNSYEMRYQWRLPVSKFKNSYECSLQK